MPYRIFFSTFKYRPLLETIYNLKQKTMDKSSKKKPDKKKSSVKKITEFEIIRFQVTGVDVSDNSR